MIEPGLCSVTFRSMGVDEISRLVDETGLRAIEWGADVHVPPGDRAAIERARIASLGLTVSYGSYLFSKGVAVDRDTIAITLDTAVDLGAAMVRVWCPFGVMPDDPRRAEVVAAMRSAAALAAERGLRLGLEFHGGTLTATARSTADLLAEVAAPNLTTYWQPPYWLEDRSIDHDVADVASLGSAISNLHVYEWTSAPDVVRRPLAEGETRWSEVITMIESTPTPECLAGHPRLALLEFVAGDATAQLDLDAATLLRCVDRARNAGPIDAPSFEA